MVNHDVSTMAFILLLLELVVLLAVASVALALWLADGRQLLNCSALVARPCTT